LSDTTFTTAVILTPSQALQNIGSEVDRLIAARVLEGAEGAWIANKVAVASRLDGRANPAALVNQLHEILQRLDRDETSAPSLVNAVRQLIQSLTS
jgi:hypothetical protein